MNTSNMKCLNITIKSTKINENTKKCLKNTKTVLTQDIADANMWVSKKDTYRKEARMNKALLESKMKLYGDTGGTLSDYLGISRSTLSAKINEKAEFTQREISQIKSRYELSADEVDGIFFTLAVS